MVDKSLGAGYDNKKLNMYMMVISCFLRLPGQPGDWEKLKKNVPTWRKTGI